MKDSPWENLKDALAAWNFIPCSGSLSAEFEGPIETSTFGTVFVKLLFDNQCCTEFPRACLARQYDGLCFRKMAVYAIFKRENWSLTHVGHTIWLGSSLTK